MFQYIAIGLLSSASAAHLRQKSCTATTTKAKTKADQDCLFEATQEEAIQAIHQFDTNQDGLLDFGEVVDAIQLGATAAYGYTLSDDDKKALRVLFDMADADGSGKIDENEWKGAIESAWDEVDADQSGTVNFCELAEAIQRFI